MMTGILTGNSLPVLFYETLVFGAVTGFAIYDLIYRRVPDRALVLFCPVALASPFLPSIGSFSWQMVSETWLASLAGAAAGFGILLTAALVSKDGTGVGGGDIKLAAATGLVLGLPASLTASILGLGSMCLVCGLITVKRRLHGKKEKIPFPVGPFLAAGAAAAYFMKIGGLIL